MNKKRGLIFVVLVLVLALIVMAPSDTDEEPLPAAASGEEKGGEDELLEEFPVKLAPKYLEMFVDFSDCSLDGCDDGDQSAVPREGYVNCGEPSKGCSLRVFNEGCTDDKSCTGHKEGMIITSTYVENLFSGTKVSGSYDDETSYIWCKNVKSSDENHYLCAEDHAWRQCSMESINQVAWLSDSTLYKCVLEDELLFWKEIDIDVDHDGFISSKDCDDNPFDDPIVCAQIKDTSDCQNDPVRYSQCAICINPSAPEICGDGLNNDCRGKGESFGSIDFPNSATPDDCNLNKYSCQQIPERNPEGTPISPKHNNIYGVPFSWVDADGGQCCGFNGLKDLGDTATTSDGDYVCITNEPSLVGVAGGDPEQIGSAWNSEPLDQEARCEGEWCWVSAGTQGSDATIYTIKTPEETFDIVSNGEKWVACKADGTNGISSLESATNPEDIKNANRFYCYQQGNTWQWADCRDPLAVANVQNGVKERIEGDGLFALPLGTEGAKSSHFIEVEELFTDFYHDSSIDFSGYEFLEFYIRFPQTIHRPADVTLQINGPDTPDGKNIYFRQNILGYATNNPDLTNKWIHVKVPVPEMLDVQDIKFESTPELNLIQIRNVYFSNGDSLICSGESSEKNDNTAWLSDLDQWVAGEKITGKRLCNTLYDPDFQPGDDPELGKAWLGDLSIDQLDKRCCGNQAEEYFAGDTNGCWNSQPIAPGETVMNVEFEVTSTYEEFDITYPEESFIVDYEKEELITTSVEELNGWFCPTKEQLAKNYGVESGDIDTECTGQKVQSSSTTCRVFGYEPDDILGDIVGFVFFTLTGGDLITGITSGSIAAFGLPNTLITNHPCIYDAPGNVKTIETAADLVFNSGTFYLRDVGKGFEITEKNTLTPYNNNQISSSTSPLKIATVQVDRQNFINPFTQDTHGSITLTSTNELVDLYFVNEHRPFGTSNILTYNDLHNGINNLIVMAKLNDLYKPTSIPTTTSKTKTPIYSCQQEECIYPIPGRPNYKITNLHPELYDMYFVTGDQDQDQTLITEKKQQFKEEGNILVKKIAQQVIYDNAEQKFYGCQAADFITTKTPAENVAFCTIKAQQFCSYTANFNTVNSWTTTPYKHIRYLIPEDPKPGVQLQYTDITSSVFAGDLLATPTETFSEPSEEEPEPTPEPEEQQSTETEPVVDETSEAEPPEEPEPTPEPVEPKSITVNIQDFKFSPSSVTVNVGDSITFVNKGDTAHTATADDNSFNTGTIEPGQSKTVKITKQGSAPFTCNFHPDMKGTVTAKGSIVGAAIFVGSAIEVPEQEVESPLNPSKVLPARNIISNAEWELELNKLRFWTLLKDNAPKSIHKDNIQGTTLTLANNEALISERIAVPMATNFHFSQDLTCQLEITLIDKNGNPTEANLPEFNTLESTYIIIKFTGPCEIKQPQLQYVDPLGTASYNYQPTTELARSGVACCAGTSCWNGYACVPEMSSQAFISEHIEEGRDYRCILGEWKYLPVKLDWNKENIGFCAEESSCFVTTSATGESPSAATFTDGNYPVCIKNGEYILDHYCQNGNWTSRTKFLSQSLVEAAANLDDEFIIYCSSPQNTLLDIEFKNNFIIGEFPVTVDNLASSPLSSTSEETEEGTSILAASSTSPTPSTKQLFTCFKALQDAEGQRLIPPEKNTCINNVCIFQHKKSGKFITAFATTLNKPANQPGSFIQALDLSPEILNENCQGDKQFIKCKNLPIVGDLYYSKDLNAIIYGKDGFDLEPGFFGGISNFFGNLFGNNIDLEDEKAFLAKAENFNELYLLNVNDKEVRAVREAPSDEKETLVVEYEGFKTPLCQYTENRIPPTNKELLELAGQGASYTCIVEDSIQKFSAAQDTAFWWKELTGKLRVE